MLRPEAELPLVALKEKISAELNMLLKRRMEGSAEVEDEKRGGLQTVEPPSLRVVVPAVPGGGIEGASLISDEPPPLMPVRRLQNYAFCLRQFYFQWVENVFLDNADTVEGSAVHRQTDKPSALPEDLKELELPEGARLRSLQLESATLGLVGKIDVCEGTSEGIEVIDHKKGSARRGENGERLTKEYDAVQVAAYALLLREAGHVVTAASIYYASDRRRVSVPLTDELLASVLPNA